MKFAAVYLWSAIAFATECIAGQRERDNLPSASFQVDWKRLSRHIEDIRKEWKVPGLAVGVVHKGDLVFGQGFGVKNIKNEPVTTDTLFQIGSTTKAFTSFAVASLVDQGKLDWTTPVSSIYNVTFADPVTQSEATLIDIMSHRTGVSRNDLALFVYDNTPELLSKIQYMQPFTTFRNTFKYNNHMFVLAGTIAAQSSGLGSWDSLIQTHILDQLNMTSTLTDPIQSNTTKDYSIGFYLDGNFDGNVQAYTFDEVLNDLKCAKPAGGIVSNVKDMAKWVAAINRQGATQSGQQLLSSAQFSQLITPITPIPPAADEKSVPNFPIQFESYALGWFTQSYRGKVNIQHGGATTGFSSHINTFPNDDFAIVVFNNLDGSRASEIVSKTVADFILFKDKVNDYSYWSNYFMNLENAAEAQYNEEAAQLIASRNLSAVPVVSAGALQGNFENPLYGVISLTLNATGSQYLKAEWKSSLNGYTGSHGIFGFWDNIPEAGLAIYGLFEFDILKYKNYTIPDLGIVVAPDSNSFTFGLDPDSSDAIFSRI